SDANDLERAIRAAAAGEADDAFHRRVAGFGDIDSVGRAEGAGDLQAGGFAVDGDDLGDPGGAQRLDDEQPDHAAADHHGRVAGGRSGPADRMHGDGHGFDHGGVLKGQVVRQPVQNAGG